MPVILGVDYGERRVGLAISDPEGIVALALRVATVVSDRERIDAVRSACEDTEAEKVVVGLPLNMDGTTGPMAEKVLKYVDRLGAALPVSVETWDERLSTSEAERSMLEADLSRKKRKKVRDKMAAQVILQGYLDAQPNPAG